MEPLLSALQLESYALRCQSFTHIEPPDKDRGDGGYRQPHPGMKYLGMIGCSAADWTRWGDERFQSKQKPQFEMLDKYGLNFPAPETSHNCSFPN